MGYFEVIRKKKQHWPYKNMYLTLPVVYQDL